MTRTALALPLVLVAVAGCDRDKGSSAAGPTGGPDVMSQKPTEEEVRRKVWSRNSSKNVTLRSPLMEVPDLYFAKNNRPVDPAAVACYVAIRSGPPAQPTEPPGKTTIQLVVIGRDSGQQNAKDRGKITEYQIIEQWAARDAFGPDWLAKHPWPKDPDAGGSGGE